MEPLDLRRLGWPDGEQPIVPDLAARHALPQYLGGRSVTFFYLGDAAGTQPALPVPLRLGLTQMYLDVCQGAGAARCEARDDPPSELPSAATASVPVVELPFLPPPPPGDVLCERVVPLSTVLLFEPNSAVLVPGALDVLRPFAEQIRESAGQTILSEIAGHTANFGPGDGLALSRQRAQAVAQALLELGVPPSAIGSVVGYGDTRQVGPNRNPDGSPSPLAYRNRRVEITTVTGACLHRKSGGPR